MKNETRRALALGPKVAAALSGSWRLVPPLVDFAVADWPQTAARLLETGAGALGWWRVRGSHLHREPASMKLRHAYRLHSIHAGVREHLTARVFDRCREWGVEPLVAKGWAVACMYPEAGLRPSGDIDLFVRPEQYEAAEVALADFRPRQLAVDLHRGIDDLVDRPLDEVLARSEMRPCGTSRVRIAGPEDSLRHVCVHLMRHGAWRPLWLVDVAATVESVGDDFDWDYCLRGNAQRTQAVCCAVGLAHHLLGARVDRTPVADRARCLPRWLVPSVLHQWGRPYERFTDLPFASTLGHPVAIVPALRRRWPNEVESTMSVCGPFNNAPRLPLQVADGLVRLGRFVRGLPRYLLS